MSRYFYLEASLPMLKRDESPAMGLEPFLSLCSEWISKSEMDILSQLSMKPEQGLNLSKAPTAAAYLKWEESLRNKLAKSRAVKQGQDPDRYMQPADEFFCEAERIVQESAAASSPLEREKLLDNARWRKLEDLEFCHFFDFDLLCIYKLKLMLREKWQIRNNERGSANLDIAVSDVRKNSASSEKNAIA